MCASIWLKFGNNFGGLNVNTSIKFRINLINVISNFTHKAKLNFCHEYRLNCFEEQADNRYVQYSLLITSHTHGIFFAAPRTIVMLATQHCSVGHASF